MNIVSVSIDSTNAKVNQKPNRVKIEYINVDYSSTKQLYRESCKKAQIGLLNKRSQRLVETH